MAHAYSKLHVILGHSQHQHHITPGGVVGAGVVVVDLVLMLVLVLVLFLVVAAMVIVAAATCWCCWCIFRWYYMLVLMV